MIMKTNEEDPNSNWKDFTICKSLLLMTQKMSNFVFTSKGSRVQVFWALSFFFKS